MSKGEFNLLHEKWILATDSNDALGSFSLLEVFEQAHKLKSLAGELPTQDIAILRLLLSVLHTVFHRYSPNGKKEEVESQSQAIERWKEIWESGKFPYPLIRDYLLSFEDHFYLFHDEFPFLQVKSEKGFLTSDGKKIAVSEKKLGYFIGEIAESGNKDNLFISRERNDELPCDESARWLIHLNSFDLSPAGRPPENEVKIIGYGSAWLTNLGLVYLQGETLYKTLMLNLVLGSPDEDDYQDEEPTWETETEIDGGILEATDVPMPRTLSKLYSMRFRFLELIPGEDKKSVSKVLIWSGCKFGEEQNQFLEPMTVWKRIENNFKPRPHSTDKRIWQDFGTLLIRYQTETKRPGVLDWIQELTDAGVNSIGLIKLQTTGYETKNNSAIKDVFTDGFAIHSQLIGQTEEGRWLLRIRNEVESIEHLAQQIEQLAKDLEVAKGNGNGRKIGKAGRKAKELAYSRLDVPFRQWLEHIDPENDDTDEICKEWREEAKSIIRKLGEELVDQAGPRALVGRNRDGEWYTVAKAHIMFLGRVKKI